MDRKSIGKSKLDSIYLCYLICINNLNHNNIKQNNLNHNNIKQNNIKHNNIKHNNIKHNNIKHNNIKHNNTVFVFDFDLVLNYLCGGR